MAIILENKSLTSSTKNTGKSKQDLFDATIGYALTKSNFAFDSIESAKSKVAWDKAKKQKDIVVLFSVESSELANAEATYYESRTVKKETKAARKGIKFKHHLDMHSHAALKSYTNSGYTRIIEFTEDGKIKTEDLNGKIVGQKMNEFIVGMLQEPVIAGDPASTTVEVVYKDYNSFENNAHVLIPDFDLEIYEGIYDVRFEVVSATKKEIKLKAITLDGNEVSSFIKENFKLKDEKGTIQEIGGVTYSDTDELYSITGNFVSGTISTSGVIEQTNIMYEAAAVQITV